MRHHQPVRRVHQAHQAEDGRAAGVHQRRAVLDNQSSTALVDYATRPAARWCLHNQAQEKDGRAESKTKNHIDPCVKRFLSRSVDLRLILSFSLPILFPSYQNPFALFLSAYP